MPAAVGLTLPSDVWEIVLEYLFLGQSVEVSRWDAVKHVVFAGRAIAEIALRKFYTRIDINSHQSLLSFAKILRRPARGSTKDGMFYVTGQLERVQHLDLSSIYSTTRIGQKSQTTMTYESRVSMKQAEQYVDAVCQILPLMPHLDTLSMCSKICINDSHIKLISSLPNVGGLRMLAGICIPSDPSFLRQSQLEAHLADLLIQARGLKTLYMKFEDSRFNDISIHFSDPEEDMSEDQRLVLPSAIYNHPSLSTFVLSSEPSWAFAASFPKSQTKPCSLRHLCMPHGGFLPMILESIGLHLTNMNLYYSDGTGMRDDLLSLCPNLVHLTLMNSFPCSHLLNSGSLVEIEMSYPDTEFLDSLEHALEAGHLPKLAKLILHRAHDKELAMSLDEQLQWVRGASNTPDWRIRLRNHGVQLVDANRQLIP